MPVTSRFVDLHGKFPTRLIGGACLAVILSGCLDASGTGNPSFVAMLGAAPGPSYKRAMKEARLAGGDVVVAAPRGFCIDPVSVRRGDDDSFALLASCAALGAGPEFDATVFTITVSAARPGLEPPGLQPLIAIAGGDGILAQREVDGIAIVQLAQGGNRMIAKADPKHWRALFLLNDRLVALAAYGEADSPLARSLGGVALERLAKAIRRASAGSEGGFDLLSLLGGGSQNTPTKKADPAEPAPLRFSLPGSPVAETSPLRHAKPAAREDAPASAPTTKTSTEHQENPVKTLFDRLFKSDQLAKE